MTKNVPAALLCLLVCVPLRAQSSAAGVVDPLILPEPSALLVGPDAVRPPLLIPFDLHDLPPLTDEEERILRAPTASGIPTIGVIRKIERRVDLGDIRWPGAGDTLEVGGGELRLDLERGTYVWTARFATPGANEVRLHLSELRLPAGSRVRVGTAAGAAQDWSSLEDEADRRMLPTHIVEGDEILLEVEIPEASSPAERVFARLTVDSIVHFARDTYEGIAQPQLASCQVAVPCVPETEFPAAKLDLASRAVATYWFQFGPDTYGACTGALINNSNNDGTPYFLTAHHCGVTPTYQNTVYATFNYRNVTCGGSMAATQSVQGAMLLASWEGTDFALLRLSETPKNAVFLGFDGSRDYTADYGLQVYGVHSPGSNPFHYRRTSVTGGGTGCFPPRQFIHSERRYGASEPGSSGSPLFLESLHVIGQLYGRCGGADWCSSLSMDGAIRESLPLVRYWLLPGFTTEIDSKTRSPLECTGPGLRGPDDVTVLSGSGTFQVVGTGTFPLTYQWYRGLRGDLSNPVTPEGEEYDHYTFSTFAPGDTYWVRVRNLCGQETFSRTASVRSDLLLELHAEPASVTAGQPVELIWTTSGATGVRIDPGIGNVPVANGEPASVSTTLAATTAYTVSTTDGTATQTADLRVLQAGPVCPDGALRLLPDSVVLRESSAAIELADLDGDRNADLVVGEVTVSDAALYVHKGRGDGLFDEGTRVGSHRFESGLATADFSGDRIADVAFSGYAHANPAVRAIFLFKRSSDGQFEITSAFTLSGDLATASVNQMSAGDVDGDGVTDLLLNVYFGGASRIVALRNDGTGLFARYADNSGSIQSLAVFGDFTGDGRADVIAESGASMVINSLDDGAWTGPQPLPLRNVRGDLYSAHARDLDGDGDLDLVIGFRYGVTRLINGPGGFTSGAQTAAKFPGSLLVEDFTGDGIMDAVLISRIGPSSNLGDPHLLLFRGGPDGEFDLAEHVPFSSIDPAASNYGGLRAADIDRDGHMDVVLKLGSRIRTFLNGCPRSSPQITAVSPAQGSVIGGTPVVIEGTGFARGASVIVEAPFQSDLTPMSNVRVVSPTRIEGTTPAHPAGATTVIVVNPDQGLAFLGDSFTFLPPFGPPTAVAATANSPTTVLVSWAAVAEAERYEVLRRHRDVTAVIGQTTGTSLVDGSAAPGMTYFYSVRALNAWETSARSAEDHATTIVFTNRPLAPGVTLVRLAHLAEVRQAADAFRAAAAAPPYAYDWAPVAGMTIRAVHVQQLREAITGAYAAAGLPPFSFRGPVAAATRIDALTWEELGWAVR